MTSHTTGITPRRVAHSLDRIKRSILFQRQLMKDSHEQALDMTQPLWDAVRLLDELGVSYALIGGLASMIHGRARHTLDADFVAAAGYETILSANPRKMRKYHFDPNCTWKLYHDSGFTIDIWKDEHSDGIVERAQSAVFKNQRLRVAEPHDLIAMKLRAGRAQDVYDISEILKHNHIDPEVIRSRVTAEQFEHFLEIKRRYAS